MKTWKSLLAVALAFACGIGAAQPAAYPSKPVHVIVPYPAGGMPDRVARDVGRELQLRLNQPVVVENKPGASGSIGFELAARQPADGYTLVLAPASNLTTQKTLFKSAGYEPDDFVPLSILVQAPQVLLVNNSVQARTVGELVTLAKAQPGKLNFGATLGAFSHLAGELLQTQAGAKMTTVPYQGSNLAVQDLIGGHVQLMFYDSVSAIPLIQGGKVRALGVASSSRLPALPDVPTMNESGLSGFEAISWYALVARTGTPAPVMERLSSELQDIVKSPALRKRYEDMGAATVGSTSKEAAAFVKAEAAKWQGVVKAAGLQPN